MYPILQMDFPFSEPSRVPLRQHPHLHGGPFFCGDNGSTADAAAAPVVPVQAVAEIPFPHTLPALIAFSCDPHKVFSPPFAKNMCFYLWHIIPYEHLFVNGFFQLPAERWSASRIFPPPLDIHPEIWYSYTNKILIPKGNFP